MSTSTYQPAPTETLGEFVDLLFQRLFFRDDNEINMPLVLSSFEHDVAHDALIDLNGKAMSAAQFLELVKEFHATSLAKLETIKDLAVVPLDPSGRTGVVAQVSTFRVTSKADAKVTEHVSATIVKVEERGGRRVMVSLVEAQT